VLLPEDLFPWLNLVSGLLVLSVGAGVLRARVRGAAPRRLGRSVRYASKDYALKRNLTSDNAGGHDRGSGDPPSGHGRDDHSGGAERDVEHHHDARQHHSPHDHSPHDHVPHDHVPHDHVPHDHVPHDHDHAHGAHARHHHDLTGRGVLAMGASAGLIPCPSALVVLLGAVAQHQIALGLLLIVAFSAGLAATLTALGLAVVRAGRLATRIRPAGALVAVLPAASALVIVAAGVVLTARALPGVLA